MQLSFINKWCILSLFILLNIIFIHNSYASIAVIVHPSNNSQLDKTAIERLFMGRSHSFENGRSALPLNNAAGSSSRETFNQRVIGRTDAQINAYWSKLVFTGKGSPPRELSSDQEVLSAISGNMDAIGYIPSSLVTDAVRVVAVFE